MKVLQILPELNSGGVERGTLEVADYLVKMGHEALVVTNGGRLVEQLEKSGARHISMPVHKKNLSSLFQIRPFRKLLEKEKPDILHIRSRIPGWIAYLAWRGMDKATRPRLVSTVHGFYSVNRYSAVMTKGERVIAVSESIRKYILKNYCNTSDDKITVIHRGVSSEQFPRDYTPDSEWLKKWRVDFPQLDGKTVFLLPGRITRWKGQDDFIRIISVLQKKGMDVYGLIAGETHEKKRDFESQLKKLAQELGVSDKVIFLGHRKDVKEVMAVSDIIYSLSREPEAFGRVTLEAMSVGKPIIAYSHGGVEEQLSALYPQGMVEVGNEGLVIDRTLDILNRLEKPRSIEEFSLQKMLSATLGVYLQILNSSRA